MLILISGILLNLLKLLGATRQWETGLRLLFLPLALQPTAGFDLSNNVLPFFPICHQLSPSSHSQHLKISFYILFPFFSWVFTFFSSLPVLECRSFCASYPPPFSPGDLTGLSFALLSILLYFLLCSYLLVLDSSDFSIPRLELCTHGCYPTYEDPR